MRIKDLLDRQRRIHTDLKGIVDAPAGTDGGLSEEQETRAADLQAQMAKVKRLIDVQADLDETERRMSGTPVLTHASPQMTQRYAHLTDEALQRASRVASGLFAAVESKNSSHE